MEYFFQIKISKGQNKKGENIKYLTSLSTTLSLLSRTFAFELFSAILHC